MPIPFVIAGVVIGVEELASLGLLLLGGAIVQSHSSSTPNLSRSTTSNTCTGNCAQSTPADPNQNDPDDEDTDDGTDRNLRNRYLGRTPGKGSRTGRQVIERMRQDGTVRGRGDQTMFQSRTDGKWHNLRDADMAHKTDAVTYWNETGRFSGARSTTVREWMRDPNNYELEHYFYNRSAGARLGQTYQPPPRP